MSTEPGTVWVVHCIDTEGPLEEPLVATFERINARFQTTFEPSLSTLELLQRGALPAGGQEEEIARFIAPARLAYLSTWNDVERMINRVTAPEFRQRHQDGTGQPYVFTWFLIDVVGYADNPRRKPVGYHVVFDQYERMLRGASGGDGFGWHFHAVPVGGHALEYNTCWTNNDHHERSVARRLLERGHFPAIFRAGGVIERNDISWWLEQFIPFDYSSAAAERCGSPGSQWDWRHAPRQWTPYHPDWYDYRRPGSMRRAIFRCLEMNGYEHCLTRQDVAEAFDAAAAGQDVVFAHTSHDRRDLEPDIARAVALLRDTAAKYPGVRWRHANAADAARRALGRPETAPPQFTHRRDGDVHWFESDQELFGPAPFLAVQEEGDLFFRDNPTIEGPTTWAYQLPRPSRTRRIGIAASNSSGMTGHLIVNL